MYFLWGMWGDIALSLMYRGFAAPHINEKCGEFPRKCGERRAPDKPQNLATIARKYPEKAGLWGDWPPFVGRFPAFFIDVGSLKAAPVMA